MLARHCRITLRVVGSRVVSIRVVSIERAGQRPAVL
jgi:hypothetical protein